MRGDSRIFFSGNKGVPIIFPGNYRGSKDFLPGENVNLVPRQICIQKPFNRNVPGVHISYF